MECGGESTTAEDLEIASIGSLYAGPWHKKYWSSSRGKDRYPYPIGYEAIHTHAGGTYRMEIHEGLKGPLFVVTSSDRDSGSGQTPGIAWDNLQKRSGPRVKNWHGKRFSSKIDGVELFGFRNPFVQRLLRELVTNTSGRAEKNLVSPNFFNEGLQTGHNKCIQDSRSYPDLLPYLGKKQSTGKRTMKVKCSTESTGMEARTKKIRCQDLINDAECCPCTPEQGGASYLHAHDKSAMHLQEKESSLSINGSIIASHKAKTFESVGSECQKNVKATQSATLNGNCEANKDPVASLHPVTPSSIVVGNSFPFQLNNKVLQPEDPDIFVEKHVIFQEQSKPTGLGNSRISNVENKLHQTGGLLPDRLLDAELDRRNEAPKSGVGEIPTLSRTADVCVPDSMDTPKGHNKESLCSMNEKLIAVNPLPGTSTSSVLPGTSTSSVLEAAIAQGAPNDFISESQICSSNCISTTPEEVPYPVRSIPNDDLSKGLVKESLMEASTSSGSSNSSFGTTDLDLAGQELARSMMTFLLPRALPLLKKTYERRSRNRNHKSKHGPLVGLAKLSSAGEIVETVENSHLTDAIGQGKVTAGMPGRQQENIGEMMNAPVNLPGDGSLYEVVKVKSCVSNSMINEAFNERESQNDVKSVIPDSYEDVACAHDVARKQSSTSSLHESDVAPSDEVKCNIRSSELPANIGEENANCRVNDDSIMKLDELRKGTECTSLMPSVDSSYVQNNSALYFDGEKLCNAEENFVYIPGDSFFRNDKAAHLEQYPAIPDPSTTCWRDNEIPRTFLSQCPDTSCSPAKRNQISSRHDLINSVHAHLDPRCANFVSQIGDIHKPQMQVGKTEVSGKGSSSSLVYAQEIVNPTGGLSPDALKGGKFPNPLDSSIINNIPLSESIICRNFSDSNAPATYYPFRTKCKGLHVRSLCQNANKKMSVVNVAKFDEEPDVSNTVPNNPTPEGAFFDAALVISRTEDVSKNLGEDAKSSKVVDPSVPYDDVSDFRATAECHFSIPHFQDSRRESSDKEASYNRQLKDSMQLAGCYLHPSPVLSISLISNNDHLQICVLCGCLEGNNRNLFMYTVPLHVQRGISPSFIGYTSIIFPLLKGPSNGELLFERSALHFTPDGQFLVLPSSIKAPYCREQNVNCPCLKCKSDCYEENGVKVVHVELGYVSVINKLSTIETITCILVCEQRYLIAAEESGQLHVWVMNLGWSLSLEEFKLPKFDHASPTIIELKSLPKCNSLVIGHNGREDFGLWDIAKRVLLARFTSPGNSIFHMLPVGLFSWQKICTLATKSKTEEQIKEAIRTDEWLSGAVANPFVLSSQEDISVWLLVYSALDSEVRHECMMKEPKTGLVGCWRLALAAKNMVVMGSPLDNRASAVDISTDFGIVGTCDGLVYTWELLSGKKLSNLHSFQGEGVSCITVDAKSDTVAVASKSGQLLVYVQPPTNSEADP